MRKVSYSYGDDAGNVASVELDAEKECGGNVTESQHVTISLTQGETVYRIDTTQSNPLAAFLRKQGTKQAKRGRKVQS